MLSQYQQDKNELLNLYKKIEMMEGLLPIEGYSSDDKIILLEDVRQKNKQLEEEHFFVSVTGQIKSGKSTLINALIFGDEILPSDDVPHTAKITLLKYAKEPKIEVLFYSKDEWGELSQSDHFYEYIKEDLENSVEQGVHKVEVIKEEPIVKVDNVSTLSEYAARGGKYTPYVNTVTLYYPNEILKEVTVVDTPGTNDPNKIRDRVAKEWIGKTNANLYIIYAGQAFSQVDMEFMEKYLLSVPKEQKITVVNKIDTLDDLPSVKNWIKNLSRDDSLKDREIFDEESEIIYVSGLAALIDKMDKSDIELDDELDFYADKLDKKGYLNPAKYNLVGLEKVIETKLIQNKGKNIITSHRQFIDSLFEKKLRIKKSELAIHNSNLEDLDSSKEELEEKIATIHKMTDSLNHMRGKVDEELKGKVEDITEELEGKVRDIKTKTLRKIDSEIDGLSKIRTVESSIGWIVKKEVDKLFTFVSPLIKASKDNVILIVNKEMDEIATNLGEIDRDNTIEMGSIKNMIYMNVRELEYEVDRIIENYMDDNRISNLADEYKHIFWFNDTDGAKGKLKEYIQDMMKKIAREINNMFNDRINTIVNGSIVGNVERNIKNILNKKEENVNKIIEGLNQKEVLISEESEKIEKLESEIKKIDMLKAEIDE